MSRPETFSLLIGTITEFAEWTLPLESFTTVAGTGVYRYNGDGMSALNANLSHPTDVQVNRLGELFIAKFRRIRKIDTDGKIITVAETRELGIGEYGDGGPAVAAQTVDS